MGKRIQLPGSGAGETAEFDARSNRFSAVERDTLAELIRWWQHRRAIGELAEPLASLVGGVDVRSTVTTTGLVPAAVWGPESLLIERGKGGASRRWACRRTGRLPGGCPGGRAGPRLPGRDGRLSGTLRDGRPSAAVAGQHGGASGRQWGSAVPGLWVVGVAGLVIGWVVEVWRLEVGSQ